MPGTTYLRVRWRHALPDEPVEIWSELDADRFELRKVEIWVDGRVGFATPIAEHGGTRLSAEPIPAVEVIGADPQFEPEEVSQGPFEARWAGRGP